MSSTITFPATLRESTDHIKPYVRFSIPPDKANPQTGSRWSSDVCLFMTDDAGSISDAATMSTTDRGKAKGVKSFLSGGDVSEPDLLVAALEITKFIVPGEAEAFTDIPGLGLDSRVAFNPQTAVLFENVEIRTYDFSYVFVPESKEESNLALSITNWFRRYLYPDTSGLFSVKYPPLFRVDFMLGESRNLYYPVYYDSFITGVDVKMNPNGRANFADGSPTSIGLDLSFQEAKQLSRETLYNKNSFTPNTGKDGMRPEYGLPPDSLVRDGIGTAVELKETLTNLVSGKGGAD